MPPDLDQRINLNPLQVFFFFFFLLESKQK